MPARCPTDAYLCGSIKYRPYFQLAASTYDGEITLTVNQYGDERDRARIVAFLRDVAEALPEPGIEADERAGRVDSYGEMNGHGRVLAVFKRVGHRARPTATAHTDTARQIRRPHSGVAPAGAYASTRAARCAALRSTKPSPS